MSSNIREAVYALAELVAKQQPRGYVSSDVHQYQKAILEALKNAGAPGSQTW